MTSARPISIKSTALFRACARIIAGGIALSALTAPAAAQLIEDDLPGAVRDLQIRDQLGNDIPLDINVINTSGKPSTLEASFPGDKPVVLTMAYYDCPLACPALMGKIVEAMNDLDYVAGKDFRLVVVSFDPTNTPLQAVRYREDLLTFYNKKDEPGVRDGMDFFVAATADDARRLADEIGFDFKYLPDIDEYSHGVGVYVTTPDARVARYFDQYTVVSTTSPRRGDDLKRALLDASDGKIATSLGDLFFGFCYTYDPARGAYTLEAFRVMRVGSVLAAVALGALVVFLYFRYERSRRKSRKQTDNETFPSHASATAAAN